jgi:folate-binding protein YgfZ
LLEPADFDVLQQGAALVPRPGRSVVRVAGADRATWLQGLLTNDVQALAPGQGCYAAWLTPQGRMITDAIVLAEDDTITVEVPLALGESVYRQLGAAVFAEDVLLTDESMVWGMLGVHGATAADAVSRATVGSRPSANRLVAESLASWPEFAHAPLGPLGRVMRVDHYGVPGFVIRVPVDARDLWLSRLRLAGATPVAAEVVEFARIEAGRPEFLVDMDADTIPLEAGIENRAISHTKGCYVGQEVIVRVVHRGGGRVARKLVGLRLAGDAVPGVRAPVRAARGEVGRVTSAAWSPRLHQTVALAYVHRDFVEPGSAVTVDCDEGPVPATVSAFPLG